MWEKEIDVVSTIFKEEGMQPQKKWGANIFYHNNEMVVACGGFKKYFSIWFYKGVFLKDEAKKLINAQEGKTKGLRQWRFTSIDEIDVELIRAYVKEAMYIAEQNLKLPELETNTPTNSLLFEEYLSKDETLKKQFELLTPYKQKEYIEYFELAKKETTKINRIEKSIPLILVGKDLHNKYKKG